MTATYPADALCARSADRTLWDCAVHGETAAQRDTRHALAKQVCAACPVAVECLRAVDPVWDEGIRGGVLLPIKKTAARTPDAQPVVVDHRRTDVEIEDRVMELTEYGLSAVDIGRPAADVGADGEAHPCPPPRGACRMTATWSVNRLAARAVALAGADRGDTRELLDMLGLLTADGRIPPDDIRQYDMRTAGPENTVPTAMITTREARSVACTTPPGLAVLPPLPKPTKAKAAPKPKRKPKEARTVPAEPRQRRKQAQCGTTSGHARHIRLREPTCEACREAKRAYMRERYDRRVDRKPRPPAPCGSRAGYERHLRDGEKACRTCLDANAAQQRVRYHRVKAERAAQRRAS